MLACAGEHIAGRIRHASCGKTNTVMSAGQCRCEGERSDECEAIEGDAAGGEVGAGWEQWLDHKVAGIKRSHRLRKLHAHVAAGFIEDDAHDGRRGCITACTTRRAAVYCAGAPVPGVG